MIRWPKHLERQLAGRLRRRQRMLRAILREELVRARGSTLGAMSPGVLAMAIRAIAFRVGRAMGLIAPMEVSSLLPVALAVDKGTTGQVVRELATRARPAAVLEHTVQAALLPLHREWAVTTAIRVRTMEEWVIERAVRAAQEAAEAELDIDRAVADALGSAETRAALLARDVLGDLFSGIVGARAQALGSRRFRWVSMRDLRVRPLHVHLDGQTFDWPQGHPIEGLPGQPFGCRCIAVPVP